jgi:6-phospho-beta-glucosidase
MPGIASAFARARDAFAGATIVLSDIDAEAVELQRRLTAGILRSRGAGDIAVVTAPDRAAAIEGADLVLTTFRPGGLAARHLDERIALDHGVVGQETAGPGGFAMALRSVPEMLAIADDVHRLAAPGAWLLNYTNPVQIVAEALARFGPPVRSLALCDQTAGEQRFLAGVLGVVASEVELDTAGTNHLTFTRGVRIGGSDATEAIWARLDTVTPGEVPDAGWWRVVRMFRVLRVIPSLYLQYLWCHDEVLAEMRAAGRTRAEAIMELLPTVLASYRDEADVRDPRPDMTRAGGDHGDFAVAVMAALEREKPCRTVINVPNDGAVAGLPIGAVVEVPCLVSRTGVVPIAQGPLPAGVSGLVQQVAAHAAATAEAAVAGDRDLALAALMLHPLVRDLTTAGSMVDAYLRAHADLLPRFGHGPRSP